MTFFKLLAYIFSIVTIIFGIVLLSIGIWTAADKIYVSSVIGDSLFSAVSYLFINAGWITMAVGIFGIYSLAKENMRLLVIFCGVLIFSALLMLVVGILAVVFKTEVESKMVDEMRKTLIDGYGSDRDVVDAWDKVQTELECCAISQELIGGGSSLYNGPYADGEVPQNDNERRAQDSWAIYKRTPWYRTQNGLSAENKKYVPKSCCIVESGAILDENYCQNFAGGPPFNYASGIPNSYLYYQGCYNKAKDLVMEQVDIILGLGFVFVAVLIGGILVTFIVIRQVKSSEHDEVKRRREPDNL